MYINIKNLRQVLSKLFKDSGLSKSESGFITGAVKMLNKHDDVVLERIKQICSNSLGFKKDDFLTQIRSLVLRNLYSWCDVVYEGLAGKYCEELYGHCGCQIISKSKDMPIVEIGFASDKYLWGEVSRGCTYDRRTLELKTGDIILSSKNDDGRYSYTILREHNHFPYREC